MEFTRAVPQFPPFPPADVTVNVELPALFGWALFAFIVLFCLVLLSALVIGWRVSWAFFKYKHTYVGRHEKEDDDLDGEEYIEESRKADTGPQSLADLVLPEPIVRESDYYDGPETVSFPRVNTDPSMRPVTNHPAPVHPSDSAFLGNPDYHS